MAEGFSYIDSCTPEEQWNEPMQRSKRDCSTTITCLLFVSSHSRMAFAKTDFP